MKRARVALLTGCLLVAGGAGAGTATANPPEVTTTGAPTVVEQLRQGPDLPEPRFVEPPGGRPPGAMPHLVPRRPGPVPIPRMRPGQHRPVPMPHLEHRTDEVAPLDRLLLRGGSPALGD